MRPMSHAKTEKIDVIIARPLTPSAGPLPPLRGEASDALLGSARYEKTIRDFGRFHRGVRPKDLEQFHNHLLQSYPGRDITVRVCPEFDSYGILLFSVYGFTAANYLCSAEEKAFIRGLSPRLANLIGPVAVFRRTGPFPGKLHRRPRATDLRDSSARPLFQSSRSAVVTGTLAARTAGNKPPMKPMASAHLRPSHSSCPDTRSSKLSLPTDPAAIVDAACPLNSR